MSCAKTAELIEMQYGLWTRVGIKEAQVQSYLPGGANMPSQEGTLAPSGEYNFIVCLQQRCILMLNYFDHLLFLLLGCIAVLRT